jgi:ketopantoate reductase
MQIAILGAGAMGSFFGGRLALAGHSVSLLDIDEAHLASIASTACGCRPIPASKSCAISSR